MPALAGIREAREEERFARYEQVIALREQGMSHQAIADHLGMGHATVQCWLKEGQFPKRKVREQASQLDPFLPYIQLRRSQGCSNMVQLHQELQARGYRGSYEGMRHILLHFRPGCKSHHYTGCFYNKYPGDRLSQLSCPPRYLCDFRCETVCIYRQDGEVIDLAQQMMHTPGDTIRPRAVEIQSQQ